MEHNVKASLEQGTLIPNTHVNHEIDNLIEMGHAWMVQSTHHLDVRYKVPFPFIHYTCCTCEWALCGNLCKHQIVVSITCIDFTPKIIIHYCGIWYGSNCGNFEAMFTNPTYLQFYDEFNDEEPKVEDPWVVDMGELMTQDDTLALNVGEKSNINLPSNLKTPTHKTFMHMNGIMQKILDEVKEGDVQFIDHATSLLHVVASHV